MKAAVLAFLLAGLATTAAAQTVAKSYSYFAIGGDTLEEIERELQTRGPQVGTEGKRHPGATRMEFTTRITYGRTAKACRVEKAEVAVTAKVILPRWRRRAGAADVALIWDTLSADIKRHEESHVIIARNHARELQDALTALPQRRDCDRLKREAAAAGVRILKKHDGAQDRFDLIEGRNFQARIMRLLEYRLQQRGARG